MTPDDARRIEALSPRQKEILRLLSHRLQQKEVAKLLGISPWTVRDHIEEAREKLQVETTREAILLWVDYEAGSPPIEWGPPTQGTGGIEEMPPASGYNQPIPPAPPRPVLLASDPVVGGSESRPERPGDTGSPEGRGGHPGSLPGPAGVDGGGAGDHDRVGHRLADSRRQSGSQPGWRRRLQAFERSLKTADLGRLALVAAVFIIVSVLAVGLVVVGIVGTLESLNALFHPAK